MAPRPEGDIAPARSPRANAAFAKSLNEFCSRAGHDLLGPLNQSASLLSLFIKRYRGQIGADADELLDYLQKASSRMQTAVEGVRNYLGVISAAPVPQPSDLNTVLSSALARLGNVIAESGAKVKSDPLPTVTADPQQIGSVFEALIGNAIKFRVRGEPPQVRVEARRNESEWIFGIQDNGPGIAPELQTEVLLPFKKIQGADYPGAGLGLAIAQLIVTSHGGNLWIESAGLGSASGTSVYFSLPDTMEVCQT